jgi:hypothetical protein
MAVFTPCATGTEALYRRIEAPEGDEREVLAVPVEAWDEFGKAYVAGPQGLVDATAFRAARLVFLRLDPPVTWTGRPEPAVARVPVRPVERERIVDPSVQGVGP